MCEDNSRWAFSLEEALLWIMYSYFDKKQQFGGKNIIMHLFLTNKQLFVSQDINWWTGVMWYLRIIVMFFLRCLGSFWRHPFTAVHQSFGVQESRSLGVRESQRRGNAQTRVFDPTGSKRPKEHTEWCLTADRKQGAEHTRNRQN